MIDGEQTGRSTSCLCTDFIVIWKHPPGPVSLNCVCPTSPFFSSKCSRNILNKSSYKSLSTVIFEKHYTLADSSILVLICKQVDFCILLYYIEVKKKKKINAVGVFKLHLTLHFSSAAAASSKHQNNPSEEHFSLKYQEFHRPGLF